MQRTKNDFGRKERSAVDMVARRHTHTHTDEQPHNADGGKRERNGKTSAIQIRCPLCPWMAYFVHITQSHYFVSASCASAQCDSMIPPHHSHAHTYTSSWNVNATFFFFIHSSILLWLNRHGSRQNGERNKAGRVDIADLVPCALHLHYTRTADICKSEREREKER